MLGVLATGVLDAESINNQTEFDGTSWMGEETGSVLRWYVAKGGELLDQAIVSEFAGLGNPYMPLRISTRTWLSWMRDCSSWYCCMLLSGMTLTGMRMHSYWSMGVFRWKS
jgi:hypothetical protein